MDAQLELDLPAETRCVDEFKSYFCSFAKLEDKISVIRASSPSSSAGKLMSEQEVLSAPFTRQTVRRAHGLRPAAHSTLFTQPPTALSPQRLACKAYLGETPLKVDKVASEGLQDRLTPAVRGREGKRAGTMPVEGRALERDGKMK
ncbi:hypothetical protein EYF80_023096 [Liparis tanakae]|uniref:Uncharacterized protein n=1 Tax=Liparis tanakae TaxID=230148 RepID=A0A4Z2HLS9_9TELE|nr:hypothetical protein EYF80_023096 [Liparis tanakae]